MSNNEHLDREVEKKYKRREKKKKPKMPVSGKEVVKLKKLIEKKRRSKK